MTRHTIDIEDFDAWARETWTRYASSGSATSHKKLEINRTASMFRVTDHGKVIYQGGNKKMAIQAYNEAP